MNSRKSFDQSISDNERTRSKRITDTNHAAGMPDNVVIN